MKQISYYNLTTKENITEEDLINIDKDDYIIVKTDGILKSSTPEADEPYTDIELLKEGKRILITRKGYTNSPTYLYYLRNDKLLVASVEGGKITDVLAFYDILDETHIVATKLEAIGYYLLDNDMLNLKDPNKLLIIPDIERKRRLK